jgi:heat shock protein HspQ
MADSTVQNPSPIGTESKSARKKKAKAEAAANGAAPVPAVPDAEGKDSSSLDAKDEADGHAEHPYIKELHKHIRNINKKITGMQKIDVIIAENPGVSLNDLVGERKINTDQMNAALKKPQLQAQLSQLEEQIQQYRKFDADYQAQLQKQKEDLTSQHEKELEKVKNDTRLEGSTTGEAELRKKLMVFSQFLRLAAAKRNVEEEADTDESKAFEGALLLVYGGDDKAVDTAMSLIEGSDEHVPSIDGVPLPFTCKSESLSLAKAGIVAITHYGLVTCPPTLLGSWKR